MLRIGHGYDVHKLVPNRELVLGGVTIPHSKGLLGHSDADVLTHALADAILGALREGDMGKLFPDTDPAYKDANSLELLRHVAKLMRSYGFELLDCDCTIAAQAPKLASHREEMRCNLAAAMGVSVDCVGIKSTTTEKLGFVGQEQGIAAWAVALLEK
ncbi:2-C-methyl-D-erythritol 2,4-cyclodiphosphate synthase [Atopobium fossor]|uniref:2-C-methyl-D-erythritol 2,4-cyclodiphosphate synthase n=1 Tax=Atopobium fossor TaxID=39487 RepID=UPI00040BDB50|nr:2-C-methyl-D-erythritol 2,4-cyclodiphosphate synthase [Atopobium fossor]